MTVEPNGAHSATSKPPITVCIGGFDPPNGRAEGLPSGLGFYEWNGDGATLVKTLDLEQPTWFVWSETHRMLYASHSARTWVSAISIPHGPESAELVDTVDIGSVNPAHLSLDPREEAVIASCFTGGEVVGIELTPEGRFAGVRSRVAVAGFAESALRRHVCQSEAEPHQSVFVSDGRRCLVPDRAQDTVHAFTYARPGVLEYERSIVLRPGSGPRHLAVHPSLPLAYIACELDSTVVTASLLEGGVAPVQVQTSLPDDFFGENAVSAVAVSPDGTRLIVSNRGHDSVAVYNIADDPARPTLVGWIPAGGMTPRYAGFLQEVDALCIAAMDSDVVHVIPGDTVSIDEATRSAGVARDIRHAAPACALAIRFPQ